MTLSSGIAADISDVFMQVDDFAETVVRQVSGNPASTESQTAVVLFDDSMIDRNRGKGQLTDGSLEIAESATVTKDDSYLIEDVRYEVVLVHPAVHGMKKVDLRRYAAERSEARSTRNLK